MRVHGKVRPAEKNHASRGDTVKVIDMLRPLLIGAAMVLTLSACRLDPGEQLARLQEGLMVAIVARSSRRPVRSVSQRLILPSPANPVPLASWTQKEARSLALRRLALRRLAVAAGQSEGIYSSEEAARYIAPRLEKILEDYYYLHMNPDSPRRKQALSALATNPAASQSARAASHAVIRQRQSAWRAAEARRLLEENRLRLSSTRD